MKHWNNDNVLAIRVFAADFSDQNIEIPARPLRLKLLDVGNRIIKINFCPQL